MRFNKTLTVNDECLSLYDAFSLFSLFSTSVMIAFSLIGSIVYRRVDDDEIDWYVSDDDNADDEADTEEEDSEEYDELYYNELDKLEDRVLEKDDLEKLGKVILREKTPNGEVIMTYNSNTESFWYYCDDKNVKYTVLDTVARKFTIDNNCKSICVNYKAEFEKAKVAIMADQTTSTKVNDGGSSGVNGVSPSGSANASDASGSSGSADASGVNGVSPLKRSIYAKFKNYNTAKKIVSDTPNNEIANATSVNTKIYILTEKANRFTYKGQLSNYKDPNEVVVTDTVYKKVIDFATFKKSLLEKQE
jgi:hypothetical protein